MIIHIDDKKSIKSLQKEFSDAYPYLKIEFFNKPHRQGAGSEKRFMKDANSTIGKSRLQHNNGKLVIDGDMTVSAIEKMFAENYGLYVQVFRRSGKLWLETTVTDSWTIKYQNEQGKELSDSGIGNRDEDIDYHEQE
jgi:hypothetical protein